MNRNVKGEFDLRSLYNRKALVFVSLLFMVVLVSSCFILVFRGVSPFVSGASDIVVNNEAELKDAINNAAGPTIIALNKDITLTESLAIPANKDITLTSTSTTKLFKLIGTDRYREYDVVTYGYPDTIIVKGDGVLRLNGIVVTHVNYTCGDGVNVDIGGTLIMHHGEITGNIDPNYSIHAGFTSDGCGGGVRNSGTFEMYGGTISNRRHYGVHNSAYGTFSMSGGEIINNAGFGVYNICTYTGVEWHIGLFSMSGGVIRNNTGGVQNSGNFSMSGGEISANIAIFSGNWVSGNGGGVSNSGVFSMFGGKISDNQAVNGGGVYNYPDGNFSLSGNGVISNNRAEVGGGVYNAGTFNRRDGIISGNTAEKSGDDVYTVNSGDGSSGGGNGSGESSNWDGFSLRDILIICVGVIGVVGVILFFIFKREKKPDRGKNEPQTRLH